MLKFAVFRLLIDGFCFAAPLRVAAIGLFATALIAPFASAQTIIEEIRVRVLEPAGGAVRPLEEAILEVQVYGILRSKDGRETRGRLPADGAFMALGEKNSGWLSKAYQCPNFRMNDYVRERRGGWMDILSAAQPFALKSCYVYTAPYEPGSYLVQASIDGMAGDLRVQVSTGAPSTRKPEGYQFPPEPPSRDPYFPIVEYYAPFIAQETWFNPMGDALTRLDYDGDFQGDNNWTNLGEGSTQAYVYYAVMETETHWFLHYNFFHPRDYSDVCIGGTCHENDNEGLILAVRKDGSRFGKAEVMQTLAHDILFTYSSDERIADGAHEVKAPLVMHEGSHPMVFIEAGGHGVLGIADRTYSQFEHQVMDWLPGTTGITYSYKGLAERPFHAGATNVGYALLPIYEHWWLRSSSANRNERTFADYFTYQPFGDRPMPPISPLAGAFLGVRESANKAKPFWGWHDGRTLQAGILARGQWGLDPAYGFSKNLRFPNDLPISLKYHFNPYLGIGAPAGASVAQTTALKQSVPWAPSMRRPHQVPLSSSSVKAPVPRPVSTTAPQVEPVDASARPSLGGFGDLSRPGGGWDQPASTEPADSPRDGISGWDPAPDGTPSAQPGDGNPPEEGPRGWGTTPNQQPKDGNAQPAPPAQNVPRGWGLPANPPKNSHE
ncbi:MAG: hypothetical protein KIT83_04605 [Bryobacterales bacterium]|nr:hypothetical protein [Bryobacterales bacterium]